MTKKVRVGKPFETDGVLHPAGQLVQDGVIDFTTIDSAKTTGLIMQEKCGICALKLGKRCAFLGHPAPPGEEALGYRDVAMHIICAKLATRLCPHIAKGGYELTVTKTAELKWFGEPNRSLGQVVLVKNIIEKNPVPKGGLE